MALDLTSLLLATVIILVFYLWYRRHDPRLPPTPATPWPILGNLVHLERNPRKQLLRWRKQVGNIYSLYLGPKVSIVLNGYDLMKEALIKNGNTCSDRPYFFFDEASGYSGMGIIFSSGAVWKEQREITMSILRSLGMGKNIMAERIQEVAQSFIEALASKKGNPTDIEPLTTVAVSNVMASLVVGYYYKYDDEYFLKAISCIRNNLRDAPGTSLINFFPALEYLPGDLFKAKAIKARGHHFMNVFVDGIVKEKGHQEYDEQNTDNFIAAYVKEMKQKRKAGTPTTMGDINLKRCVYDLFAAGMETASSTLCWCVLYLLQHPDMQEKLYQEMEREIGTQRLTNMHDKLKLTYLNAFILETQRLANIAPLSVIHATSDEVTLGGYTFPKGTELITNLDSVLWDEDVWGPDVMSFQPERFIDEDGNLKQHETFIPYSIGKRTCAGESLAKMELFLFFSAMIQRFKFVPVDPSSPPPLKDAYGFSAPPIRYEVRALDRRILY